MGNNYDGVAGYYDLLSQLVFGQAEINAQVGLLPCIKPGSRILIVGGGTGWILEKLAALHPSGLHITYVERSARMMGRSKKRKGGRHEICFIQLPVEQWVTEERYDYILTGFFFDNFPHEMAASIFKLLHARLRSGGCWLFSDFYYHKKEGKLWQALLLQSLYLSARLLCGVEGRELADMEPLFAAAGYEPLDTSFHYGRFIKSIVYRKN